MFSCTSFHIRLWANTMTSTFSWWKTNGISSSGVVPAIWLLQRSLTLHFSLAIFVGFASFFMMEKTLRVLGSEEGGHSHSHSHSRPVEGSASHASGVELSHSNGELKARKEKGLDKKDQEQVEERSSQNGPSKLSAYLNLFGDFVHNMYVPRFSVVSLYLVAHSNVSALTASRKAAFPPRFDASIRIDCDSLKHGGFLLL